MQDCVSKIYILELKLRLNKKKKIKIKQTELNFITKNNYIFCEHRMYMYER